MTWNIRASGHHTSPDWEAEERDLLARIVDAIDHAPSVTVIDFAFSGNHGSVSTLDDAREWVAAELVALHPMDESSRDASSDDIKSVNDEHIQRLNARGEYE